MGAKIEKHSIRNIKCHVCEHEFRCKQIAQYMIDCLNAISKEEPIPDCPFFEEEKKTGKEVYND